MDVVLTPELERQIAEAIEKGRYGNADQVVQDALNCFFDSGALEDWTPDQITAAIEHGWDQAKRGQLIDGETARRNSLEKLLAPTT